MEHSSIFDCSPERVWREVKQTKLLSYIAFPLQVFQPIQPPTLPTEWAEGDYLVLLKAFGILRLGRHYIRIQLPEPDAARNPSRFQLRDNGGGRLIPTWDHLITIEGDSHGGTRYTDRVEIRAGIFTPVIWLYANLFYRYRQQRWQRLIQHRFVYS